MSTIDDYIKVHKLSCKSRRGDGCSCGRDAAEAELAALRDELAEIKASYKRVMDEQCAPDEQHCACVPALRARIKELEADTDRLLNLLAILNMDGGHYVEEHGLEAAYNHAVANWYERERLAEQKTVGEICQWLESSEAVHWGVYTIAARLKEKYGIGRH